MDYETIRAGLREAVPFNRHVGLEVVEIGAGKASVLLPEGDHLKNHVGTQHAAGLFAAGEAASGAAVFGAFAERMGSLVPLAREARVRYLKLANGPITAASRIDEAPEAILERLERDGKVAFDVAVDLADAQGTKVAEMTVAWHLRRVA